MAVTARGTLASERASMDLRPGSEEPSQPSGWGSGGASPQRASRVARAAPPWMEAAFDVALDRIMGAAFVVTSRGRIVHASSSGRALMRAQRASTEVRIASSPLRFPIPRPGRAAHELVLLDPAHDEALLRAEAIGAVLGLSGQERRVLGLVANGLSNRQIAIELGCVEKTAETHVSGILAKTDCPSRTSLVARFWTHTLR